MRRPVPILLGLLAAAAALALDWREVSSVRVPEGEAVSVAVDGETVWKRVPYDAEIEYLESTGTQYVDTGVHVGPGSRSETDVAVLNWDASTYALSGTTETSSRHSFGKGYSGSSLGSGNATKLYFGLGAQNYASSVVLSGLVGIRHIYWIDVPSATAGMDGKTFALTSAGTITTNRSTSLLLAQSVGSNVRGWMVARLYGYRHYENGTLVRDFTPVRVESTGYLYDRVSGQLFGNMGTGAFVLGPDK